MTTQSSVDQNVMSKIEESAPIKSETIQVIHEATSRSPVTCEAIEDAVNSYLAHAQADLANQLVSCTGDDTGCACGDSSGATKVVDLVVLLDSSDSMYGTATTVSNAAEHAIKAASIECPSDLRVTWLVVDGRKPGANAPGDLGDITATLAGTPFTQSHQQYLEARGSTGPFKQDEAQPSGDIIYPGEEGGDSIADLCNFFDWRPRACKAIFYISDTALDSHFASYNAAATNATAAAIAHGVALFAHKIVPGEDDSPGVEASYDNLTLPTGGNAYHGPVDVAQYQELLKHAICNACGPTCKEVVLPAIAPCISMSWGQSDCDCFETDDVETVIITLCNCYSNITLSNVHISYFYVTMFDGSPVPLLPDGTPSVEIVPVGPVCFGDIGPCREGENNCVSREIVIRTRGAKSGKYKIVLGGICFDIVLHQLQEQCFALTLCED